MTYKIPHYIQGKRITSDPSQNIFNPATGEVIGQVALANQNVVDQAVAAAKKAFPTWSTTTPLKRARMLFTLKTLLEKHSEELAQLVTQEHGKTLVDARGSVQRGIDVVEFVCGIPQLLKGSFSENVATDMDCFSVRQALGVCVGITPFNFPVMIPLWMFPMAIACGNTFILKPSEKDPSCSIRLAELAGEAGIPPGVLNVIQGDKIAVDALLMHPDVKAVSFVGSTPVAEYVHQTATQQGKRVAAFGGAKNHGVVMPDADLDQVVDAIVGAAYGSAGERCMAISVVVAVGDQVADALIKKIKPRVEQLKIGAGTQETVEMGPLISQAHVDRVKSYIELGEQEGATLIVDGRQLKKEKGFFLGGTLFDHVKPHMRIYREEIFGPVLSIVRVPDLHYAIKIINEHDYGNGTAIFTQDGNAARSFSHQVEVGMVGINIPIPVPVAYHSFGGWKRSIFSDIPMHGQEGVHFYTKVKTITQKWLHDTKGAEFSMPTH